MQWIVPHSAPMTGTQEVAAITRVIESGHLAQGRETRAFEEECAAVVGRKFGVAVNSGTSALHLVLEVLKFDSPVVVPTYGCAALITAVHLAGATPILGDIGEDFNLAPVSLNNAPIILPHLFGVRATVPESARVIEDLAQSIGGPTGKFGVAAIASFYATKMITTGEGGMVLTDDTALADAVRDRRDYDGRDDFQRRYNYKMTDLQAAMGREQLKRLPAFIARRRSIARAYDEAFAELPMQLPTGEHHVYFRYVALTPRRAMLEANLNANGIEAKRPVFRPAHHFLGGDFPMAERAHNEAISIPIYPAMSNEQVGQVIAAVRGFFAH